MPQYTVNFDTEHGEMPLSWTGEADDEMHAVDLAREEADTSAEVVDVFEES